MAERCTGHCCRDIVMRHSPGELAAGHVSETGARLNEAPHIAHILYGGTIDTEGKWHYNCLYLMGCGDCAIYGSRPSMCRDYPYQKALCCTEGCTWSAVNGEA